MSTLPREASEFCVIPRIDSLSVSSLGRAMPPLARRGLQPSRLSAIIVRRTCKLPSRVRSMRKMLTIDASLNGIVLVGRSGALGLPLVNVSWSSLVELRFEAMAQRCA